MSAFCAHAARHLAHLTGGMVTNTWALLSLCRYCLAIVLSFQAILSHFHIHIYCSFPLEK